MSRFTTGQDCARVDSNSGGSSTLSPKEVRGQRIRQLLTKLDMSMTRFAKKHGIKPATLGSWEQGNHGGLTPKGALTLAEAFQREGLTNVTFDWLLHGKGFNPLQPISHSQNTASRMEIIIQELQLFHQLNPNAVDAIIPDNSLEPCFSQNDLVAGMRQFGKEIEELLGATCIVQLIDGQVLVRQLNPGDKAEQYTLTCGNTKSNESMLKNVTLFSAARVIWHRRPY